MNRQLVQKAMSLVLGILSGLVLMSNATAQVPDTPRPTPLPIPIDGRASPPQPATRPVTETIDPGALSSDLELELRPRSDTAPPTSFVVENTGLGPARAASLLRVTIRLLPLAAPGTYLVLDAGHFGSWLRWRDVSGDEHTEICPLPYSDFQAAISPLAPGESQTVSETGARRTGGRPVTRPAAARPATRIPTHSYFTRLSVDLVCVYELRATVDANAEIRESNEGNNEVVHYFQRKHELALTDS